MKLVCYSDNPVDGDCGKLIKGEYWGHPYNYNIFSNYKEKFIIVWAFPSPFIFKV
jgi:hypothetical protein